MPRWTVIGGADKGGILVRTGQDLSSPATPDRLCTGAVIEQLQLEGERLHYKLLEGTGPQEGWVSIKVSGKDLLVAKGPPIEGVSAPHDPARTVVGPGSGCRHRWAVNIDEWDPEGGADGPEFQYLLGLIQEEDDKKQVMKYKFPDDKKRALMSRLLMRQASASVLGHDSFKDVVIKRTKGKKPFLASPLPDPAASPNWNVNCSHEGCWVVCASEPLCIAGIDVAELRRFNKRNEPIDFRKSFKANLTESEWRDVDAAGADFDDQYEVFSRFWSAKEAFVKARGDGLAYELGKAEFHWTPLEGFPERSAYSGTVVVEGKEAPQWRFVQYRMPGEKPHWTTVGRGPLTSIIDANGDFKSTLRRDQASISEEEWKQALMDESPPFDIIPVASLVPKEAMAGYVEAGGKPYP
eukprot:CAMPEP_0197905746 /NCGR_PEP_ID=MMETSP1439-20131203/61037_1 /TAXON_ID=66791 /ORGANISM="Gonyaulax spinifera, Strain CCMP409" /LENGTH=408 /DNA_ID=CAMNT_0043527041 /DNA_START=45 /DNA_END=1271 /DNA_ORIENTATION=-